MPFLGETGGMERHFLAKTIARLSRRFFLTWAWFKNDLFSFTMLEKETC